MRSARAHPFAVPGAELAELLAPAATGLGLTDLGVEVPANEASILMGLPSLARSPVDSPELIRLRPRPEAKSTPILLPWRVPVLYLPAAAAGSFLSELEAVEQGVSELHDVRFGASLVHLRLLAEFAADLADRGRAVPSLELGADNEHRASWRPILQGPDLAALHGFIGATPPVARAAISDESNLTGEDPAELTADAIDRLLDAAIRERTVGVSALDAAPKRRGRHPKTLPALEGWLRALTSSDGLAPGVFIAESEDAARLADELQPWEEFATGPTGPARAMFRLAENEADGVPWRVEFWLQSVQDPTLMLDAHQVWDGNPGLSRWLDRADELLLRELGRAASIYPPLATALREARPSAAELDATGAHDFLATYSGLLEQAGFGLLLPSWWSQRRRISLTGHATPAIEGGVTEGMFTRESLYEFQWNLALGDSPLTEEEFAALTATKETLVQFRGEWVAIDPEQLARVQAFITAQRTARPQLTAGEVIALAAAKDSDLPADVTTIEATGLLGDLLAGSLDTALEPVDVPRGIDATLRPYQERGLAWLSFLSDLGLGACLADDMGLGKTLQLLSLEVRERERDPAQGPTLLLCPMTLVGNWQREAAKFAPGLMVYAHHGVGRASGSELAALVAAADVVVTTYHTAARDLEELGEYTWQRLVLDEAQAVKNHLARTSKAVRGLRARQRIALTGTPMENRLVELWALMDFLNPGILGSVESFRRTYATPIEKYGQDGPAARLRKITRPYILRRVKTDAEIAPDLPEKIEIKQYCNLTLEQASLYQAVLGEMMPKIENASGIGRRGNVLATMTKLKQVCNHPAQLLHDGSAIGARSGKVERLHEVLTEILEAGEKVLLFTQYREFAGMLLPHLAARHGVDVAYLHGGTTKARRDELVEQFQSDGGPPVFLLSLKAGGTGLTLTAASHVIHLDRWWNPAVEDQATDRAFRIGQQRNVQVRKFITTGTLEERIDDMIEQKKRLTEIVVGDGEGWLTDLSTAELRELFALSKEAVGE